MVVGLFIVFTILLFADTGLGANVEANVLEQLENKTEVCVDIILKDNSNIDFGSVKTREEKLKLLETLD